jgi:hypothetical protein
MNHLHISHPRSEGYSRVQALDDSAAKLRHLSTSGLSNQFPLLASTRKALVASSNVGGSVTSRMKLKTLIIRKRPTSTAHYVLKYWDLNSPMVSANAFTGLSSDEILLSGPRRDCTLFVNNENASFQLNMALRNPDQMVHRLTLGEGVLAMHTVTYPLGWPENQRISALLWRADESVIQESGVRVPTAPISPNIQGPMPGIIVNDRSQRFQDLIPYSCIKSVGRSRNRVKLHLLPSRDNPDWIGAEFVLKDEEAAMRLAAGVMKESVHWVTVNWIIRNIVLTTTGQRAGVKHKVLGAQ